LPTSGHAEILRAGPREGGFMESGTPTPPPAPEAPQPPAGGAISPADQTVQVRPGSGPPSAPYAVVAEFDRQEEYRRLLPIVKGILLIPHWIALFFVYIAAAFAIVAAWFAVLITGKYPRGIHRFVTGTYRWTLRVLAYGLFMTDAYPPFSLEHDDNYPARFDIAYTEQIARWRPLVNWLLVIPYAFIAAVIMMVAYFVIVASFFTILFTKRFPQALFDFNVVAMRWQMRSNVYTYWMTERYPPWQWA
jgi:hypothetical protein